LADTANHSAREAVTLLFREGDSSLAAATELAFASAFAAIKEVRFPTQRGVELEASASTLVA